MLLQEGSRPLRADFEWILTVQQAAEVLTLQVFPLSHEARQGGAPALR